MNKVSIITEVFFVRNNRIGIEKYIYVSYTRHKLLTV